MDGRTLREVGFGTIGSLEPAELGELAWTCEQLGYTHYWMNIIPGESDPIAMLGAALDATKQIDVGIGVVPIDSYPPVELATSYADANLAEHRVILGIGAGFLTQGAARRVGDAIAILQELTPATRIGVGGYGPLILRTAGRLADALCLAWMTPDRLKWAQDQAGKGAAEAGRERPPTYVYVRCAVGADADSRLLEEMKEYGRQPHHQRHQAAMASPGPVGLAVRERDEIGPALDTFTDCHVVIRGLPRQQGALKEWVELAQFFAPVPALR